MGLAVFAVCAIGAAVSIVTFGAGSVLAGAFIGASIGALSTTAIKAGEELSTGNVRSFSEAARDVVISAAAGGFTGACLIAFPATAFFSPEIYAGVSLTGRASWALGDWSMSNDKKMAYIFDTKQMAVDFSIGSLIGMLVPGMVARKAARDAERNIKEYTCKSGNSSGRTFKSQYEIPTNEKGYTKSSLELGKKVHKEYMYDVADGVNKIKEYVLPSGKRVDFIDFENKIVYELKPNNPNQIRKGTKQLAGYLEEIEAVFGKGWSSVLDTY